MEKIIIQYSCSVETYLNKLVDLLFLEDYFIYPENAISYVQKIIDSIETNIELQKHKKTPAELISHGELYISYKAGKRTTWYIFFSKKDKRHLVKYITNNHTASAALLKHFE